MRLLCRCNLIERNCYGYGTLYDLNVDDYSPAPAGIDDAARYA